MLYGNFNVSKGYEKIFWRIAGRKTKRRISKIYHLIYHFQLAESGFLPFGSCFKAKRKPLIHSSKPYVSTVSSGRGDRT